MVDIHSHILPNIDDGASSFEETIAMLEIMIHNGVTTVVATPHFDPSKDELEEFLSKREESFTHLEKLVEEMKLPIKLIRGSEVMYSLSITTMDLNNLTIGDTEYILIELPTRYDDPTFDRSMSDLLAMGYTPILAHVERYSYLVDNSQRLVDLINEGVLTQVNAKSMNNSNYPYINAMFKKNLVHFIGSDAHSTNERRPNLKYFGSGEYYFINATKVVSGDLITVKQAKKIFRILGTYF